MGSTFLDRTDGRCVDIMLFSIETVLPSTNTSSSALISMSDEIHSEAQREKIRQGNKVTRMYRRGDYLILKRVNLEIVILSGARRVYFNGDSEPYRVGHFEVRTPDRIIVDWSEEASRTGPNRSSFPLSMAGDRTIFGDGPSQDEDIVPLTGRRKDIMETIRMIAERGVSSWESLVMLTERLESIFEVPVLREGVQETVIRRIKKRK